MPNNALAIANALLSEGVTKADIGRQIGYSRSAVSLWLSGKYASPEKVAAAILARYERVICPFLGREIAPTECASFSCRPCPTSIAREARHWKACQDCEHKPTKEVK